jgi:O-antigen/teichoic acid export membrane protein
MLQKLRQTAKHTIIYSIGNISIKLAGLILMPLYNKYIPIAEYGMLGIVETTTVVLISILGLNMYVAVMRWFPAAKTFAEQKTIVSSAFFPTFIILIISGLVLFQFNSQFSELFFDSTDKKVYFNYMIGSVMLAIINTFATSLIRMKEKSGYFTIVSVTSLIITISLNIYLTAVLRWGVEGILLSQLIGYVVQFLLFSPMLIKHLTIKIDSKILKEMLIYSFPLVIAGLSAQFLNVGDRYLIPEFLGYAYLGIYSVGYKISGVISAFIISSFQLGFLPVAFKMFDKPEAKNFFIKVLTYFTLILLISALGISLFSNELLLLLAPYNEEYRLGASYIPFIAFSLVFKGMEYVILLGLHYTKKTKYSPLILLMGAILNISLNLLLITHLKLYGVAISTVISGGCVTYFYYRFSNKHYPVKYEWGRILKIFLIAISLYLITYTFMDINIFIRLALKTALFISFPLLLFVTKFFQIKEINAIKGFYQKWKNPCLWKTNFKMILTKDKKDEEEN